MKRDSSLNVYRQRKISFEDRVVVEGSKTTSINQYGAGPSTQKLSTSIISEIGGIRILSYLFLIKDPKSSLHANLQCGSDFSIWFESYRQLLLMLLEIFHDSFENFEITRICMENHASVTGWQKLFFSNNCFQLSAAVVIATFEIQG